MSRRGIALVSLVFALAVQAGFAVGYRSLIDGCCGGLNQRTQPPIALPHVIRFVFVTAQPLASVTGAPDEFAGALGLDDRSARPSPWLGTALYAGLNAVFWFAGAYLVLSALALMSRLRFSARDGKAAPDRIHLADASQTRPQWVLAGTLALVALSLAAGAVHRRWWLANAHRALHESIVAARSGAADPAGVSFSMDGTARALAPANFEGAYTLDVEPRMVGTSPLDAFAAPILWQGDVRFAGRAPYDFSVQQTDTGWKVWIGEPCASERDCLASVTR